MCDILWSDPDPDTTDWQPNERGISMTFSKNNLREFLEKNDLDLVCRGHQVTDKEIIIAEIKNYYILSFIFLSYFIFYLIFI